MTRQQLKNYRALEKNIRILRKEAERLEAVRRERVTDVVSGSGENFPYTKHAISIEADTIVPQINAAYVKCRERLEEMQLDSLRQYSEINEWIDKIPIKQTQNVFRLKFIWGLSLEKVAARLGIAGGKATVQSIIDRYLQKNL